MFSKLFSAEAAGSLLDQAATSGGNFLTAFVLARMLSAPDYGTFSLLFLSLFAINTCHSSCVVYPLTLLGAKADDASLRHLTGSALLQTLALFAPQSILLFAVTLVLHRLDVLAAMLLAMVAWQLQETVRRALLSHMRFGAALPSDMLSYVGQGVLIAIFRPKSLSTIFYLMAATSCAAALLQMLLVKPSWNNSSFSRRHLIAVWRLGRFSLAGNALNVATLQIPSWSLALMAGRTAVAGYQALLNLVGIGNPIIFSVSNLLIPAIAREAETSVTAARRVMVRHGVRYGMLLLPCFMALAIFPRFSMALVYGAASPYIRLAPLLRIFVIAFALQYLATVVGAYEGGMARPQSYMWVQIAGTFLLLTLGVALIHFYGVAGAITAMLIASLGRLLVFSVLSRHADRKAASLLRGLVSMEGNCRV